MDEFSGYLEHFVHGEIKAKRWRFLIVDCSEDPTSADKGSYGRPSSSDLC